MKQSDYKITKSFLDGRKILHVGPDIVKQVMTKFRNNVLKGTPHGGFTLMLDNPSGDQPDVNDSVDFYFTPDQEPGWFRTSLQPSRIFGNIENLLSDAFRGAQIRVATYEGNPGGDPIYPNTIDHGYGEPLAGGTDVMRRLQNQLLHEQGTDDLKRPESPRLASVAKVAEAYDCLQDYRAGGLSREEYQECLDRFKDEDDNDNYRTPYRRRPTYHAPAPAAHVDTAKLQILDKLLAKHPDNFVSSIRDQVARGKTLSEAQLKAIRVNLYRNTMRPEADNFRVAFEAGTLIGDFIGFMDANAVRFTAGPTGWWLPAHNMAVRLTKQNLVIVLKYQVLPTLASGRQAYSPGGGWKGPLLHLSPMWWKHPRFGGAYPPTPSLAQRLVGLMEHEPIIVNTVKSEMQWVSDMFNATVPPGIVTKLSMGAVKNAIVRWSATKIRYVTIPL